MKLTAVLLLSACLTASADGIGQKVSLSEKNAPLEKVFKELKKQTGFDFFYNMKALEAASPITIEVNNVTLVEVLDLCFKNQPLSYTITDKMVVVKEKEPLDIPQKLPPPIDVKGRIVNENGEPVAGGTIAVKGTNNRTASDDDGYFTLKGIDENATLVISATNIDTREIEVGGKSDLATISVKIKVTEGQAVIVEANTGYQKVKPNEIIGSVVVIDNKTLNQQSGTNILQRLDGVTSGLYFNIGKSTPGNYSTTKISIRGLSTINSPLDPLIILDNFPYDGDINNINPNDVESVTILKDAAATSIYGARGGNGVIVISTKRGLFNQKTKIDVASNIIVSKKPNFYSLPQIGINDYVNVEQFLFDRGFFDNDISAYYHPAITPAVDVFLKRRNGLISAEDSTQQINILKSYDSRADYDKYFNHTPITSQYSINLRGGNNNIAWLISGGYDRSLTNINSKSEKANIKVGNIYRPIKNLEFSVGVYYTNSKATSGEPGYNSLLINSRAVPYLKLVDNKGNSTALNLTLNGDYTDTVGGGKLLDWKYYPLENYQHESITDKIEEFVANIGLSYKIIKGLTAEVMYQNQMQKNTYERLSDIESFNTRNTINRFTQLNANPSLPPIYKVPKGGFLELSTRTISSQNLRGQLKFERIFSQHSISSLVGGEARETIGEGTYVSFYGYSKDPLKYGQVDYVNPYPDLVTGFDSQIEGAPNKYKTTTSRFVDIYANASYSYKKRYIVSASFRKDASNNYGQKTNDRWNPFWSAGLGWEVSKEAFYKFSIIPYLKIKGTFGHSGNIDITKTALPLLVYRANNNLSNFPVAQVNALNNPELRWERVKQFNIGAEFYTRKEKIYGSIEYYIKNSIDLFATAPFDYTGWGLSNQTMQNIANLKGKGIDIILKTKNIESAVKWSTILLLNYNSNKTTKYFGADANSGYVLTGNGTVISPAIGKPLYAIAAYKWAGLNSSGDPQGYLNGQVSTDYDAMLGAAKSKGINDGETLKYIGPANPVTFGSFENEINWKSFSLSINISYRFGYFFRKPTLSYLSLFYGGIGTNEFENRWKKPGDELVTNVPALVYTDYPQFDLRDLFYSNAEVNILKADNIRLQYVNLSYSLINRDKKIPFQQLQLYVNTANLGILWRANKEHFDPDYPLVLSPSKQFTLGARVSF